MMLENSLTQGIIETESGPIPVRDLSYFLYHFRAVYVEALNYSQEHQIHGLPREAVISKIAKEMVLELAKKGRQGITKNALANLLPEEELAINKISRRNPLDVLFTGVALAIAVAVIISGGEIKVDEDGLKGRIQI